MKSSKPTADMPLLDYWQHHYHSVRCGKSFAAKTVADITRLVGRLGRSLGRTPLVSDLNEAVLSKFNDHSGFLLAMWRHAAAVGLVPIAEGRKRRWRKKEVLPRPVPKKLYALSPEMPLMDFIEWQYLTTHHGNQSERGGRHLFLSLRRCNETLAKVLGRQPALSDLNQQNLDAVVKEWKTSKRYREGTIKTMCGFIFAVWRYACDLGLLLLPWEFRRHCTGHLVNRHPQDEKQPFPLVNAPHTLWGLCVREFFPKRLTIRSDDTRRQYKLAMRDFSFHLGRQAALSDLNDDSITEWVSKLQSRVDAGELTVYTLRERLGRLLTLWTWAAKRRLTPEFPTITRPPAPDPIPVALTVAQLQSLFASAVKERGKIAGIPAGNWWTAWLAFVYSTAERKSAALALRWEWIDFEHCTATIPANCRKGGRKNGNYHLPPEVMTLLHRIRQPERELVFPWPSSAEKYYLHYGRILLNAGLPNGRKYKTHCLRATHATIKTVLGVDASRALGHSDAATTRRHYIDVRHLPPDTTKLPIPWEHDAAIIAPTAPVAAAEIGTESLAWL